MICIIDIYKNIIQYNNIQSQKFRYFINFFKNVLRILLSNKKLEIFNILRKALILSLIT